MKIKVIKAYKQADPDPSKPHHTLTEGEHEVPDWLGERAIANGKAVAVTAVKPKAKFKKEDSD